MRLLNKCLKGTPAHKAGTKALMEHYRKYGNYGISERTYNVPREGVIAEGYPVERQEWANEYDPFIWFKDLWGSIYGEKHWDSNPWVWVVTFKKVDG